MCELQKPCNNSHKRRLATWFLVERPLISHWSDHSKQSIKKFMAKKKVSGICTLEALGKILTILTYGAVAKPNLNF